MSTLIHTAGFWAETLRVCLGQLTFEGSTMEALRSVHLERHPKTKLLSFRIFRGKGLWYRCGEGPRGLRQGRQQGDGFWRNL